MRRVRGHPIGFLCASRTEVTSSVTSGLDRVLTESGAERAQLGPLSVGALHQLILARLGRALTRPTIVRIATAARGNPFYVLEIAREVLRRGETSAGEPLPVPDDLSQLVSARIAASPARDPRAAAGDCGARDRSARPTGPRGAGAGRGGRAGRDRGANGFVFASAVLGRCLPFSHSHPPARAPPEPGAAGERPRGARAHLALGASEPSEALARELDHAAELASSRGAPDAAAELLELAAELTPDGDRDQMSVREAAAAECHLHAGDPPRARSVAERALARCADGPIRANVLRLLGELRYIEGSFAEAIALFDEALGHRPHGAASVELQLNLAFAHSILGADADAADHAHAALKAATEAGDSALEAAALAMSATRDFRLGRPLDRARLERALALEDRTAGCCCRCAPAAWRQSPSTTAMTSGERRRSTPRCENE